MAFRQIITRAASHHISAGRITETRPDFLQEAASLSTEHDTIQACTPGDPRIVQLNHRVNKAICGYRCGEMSISMGSIKLIGSSLETLWRVVKGLSGKPKIITNQAISFDALPCMRLRNVLNSSIANLHQTQPPEIVMDTVFAEN